MKKYIRPPRKAPANAARLAAFQRQFQGSPSYVVLDVRLRPDGTIGYVSAGPVDWRKRAGTSFRGLP